MPFDISVVITSGVVSAFVGAAASFLMQGRARWLDAQAHASALAQEVLHLRRKLEGWRQVIERRRARAVIGSMPEAPSIANIEIPPCPVSTQDMIVFSANTSKLSSLPPWLVSSVIQFYGWVRELAGKHEGVQSASAEAADALARTVEEVGRYADGRVLTELEVLAATSYWRKLWQREYPAKKIPRRSRSASI